MFNFFHTVFDVLKTQMGAEYVEHAVQTFLNLFGQNQLTQVKILIRFYKKYIAVLTGV